MHVTIEAGRRIGLKVIEEIPDILLCKIEGYNGIGKTSAIRLLSLCAGDQPFVGKSAAWQTFRSQLGHSRVSVSGLRGGVGSIDWELTPEKWPSTPEGSIGSALGTIRIDGRLATIADVTSVFRVHHVNAADTPEKILADQSIIAAGAVEGWLNSQGAERARDLDEAILVALRVLERCPAAEDFSAEQRIVARDLETAGAAEAAASASRIRSKLLNSAVGVADLLDNVRNLSPQAGTRIQALRDQLEAVNARKAELDGQIASAHAHQHEASRVEREFSLAQKHHAAVSEAVNIAIGALNRAAAEADIEPDSARIVEDQAAIERKLTALLEAKPYVNTAPLLIAVLHDLARRLDEAVAAHLGAETLVTLRTSGDSLDQSWTVAGMRDALRGEATTLAQRRPGRDSERLDNDIAATRAHLDALSGVVEHLKTVEQARTKLGQATQRLTKAAKALPDSASRDVSDLLGDRAECDKQAQEFQARIDRFSIELERLGGGKTEAELAKELDLLCQQAGVDPARVWTESELAEEEAASQEQAAAQAMAQAKSAQHAAMDQSSILERAIAALTSSDELVWLRHAVPKLGHLQELGVVEQLETIAHVKQGLEGSRQRINQAASSVRGIGAALHELASRLQGNARANSAVPTWVVGANIWLAEQVRRWFEDEIMREALFEGGQELRIDPHDLTLSWSVDGAPRSRPLTGFSSGEMTLAHTRAQLDQLERDTDPAINQLIALDEFNAFLDERRLATLGSYLGERVRRRPNDQVVVILPSGSTPQALLSNGMTQTDRDAQLAERGYFAEVFNP